ncbi:MULTISPECIES: DUF305 domain-containing protein [Microvirga]|uniref:DUF305 domain-containing protein n=2 Tax=Microvirga TaxID=186650 RepID=A0ABW9Z298_9HYPH|nr:DUF305 domain-containing protein [Microvirga arsenatis]NBJ13079.1 DUF305 domain-containing protein [Microvirga arsenatis]NBJ26802.1 DUF305 domain-containing protein [Microvirga arsenatis]
MNNRLLLVLSTVASLAASGAIAQQNQGGSTAGQMQQTADLPEACRTAVQASAQGDMMQKMQGMQGNMSQTMQNGMQSMMGQMNETQKGLHEAMMKMNRPMMMGMMAKDADVAWICSMIPHHQGAIDMARAGLKGADNAESKKLAEKTIEENEKSLKELTAWVEKHAQSENKNEVTGSTKQ